MSRLKSNQEILAIISEAIRLHPDMRFGQLMDYLGIIMSSDLGYNGGLYWDDEFYLESKDLLKRMERRRKENIR